MTLHNESIRSPLVGVGYSALQLIILVFVSRPAMSPVNYPPALYKALELFQFVYITEFMSGRGYRIQDVKKFYSC